ncbi:hypothetical protein MMC28_006743 [Mycoblastus sanguinarius]|nr:hypothetical protein [Mycoblastus sanguinarius]
MADKSSRAEMGAKADSYIKEDTENDEKSEATAEEFSAMFLETNEDAGEKIGRRKQAGGAQENILWQEGESEGEKDWEYEGEIEDNSEFKGGAERGMEETKGGVEGQNRGLEIDEEMAGNAAY